MTDRCRILAIRPWWAFAVASLCVTGCQRLETGYADPRHASINGVTGFIDMVKGTGRRVDVWSASTPFMATDYSAVVIFVSHHEQIPQETITHLSHVLWSDSLETLVIAVRDSDAAIDYWEQIAQMPDLTPTQVSEINAARNKASNQFLADASKEFDADQGCWYGLERVSRGSESPVHTIEIDSDGTPETVTTRWPLNRRLIPSEGADVLWHSGDDPLLTSQYGGSVLVLASAAPILNGGLVDPGNRRLAEELVRHLPEDGRIAIVVSSRWSDGKAADSPGIWKFLKVHPHGWIFGQALFALIAFCWWKLPIFGRPRTAVDTEQVRFGRHVEALGNLLQRTRDAGFARQIIRSWFRGEKSRRKSSSDYDVVEEVSSE